MPRSLGAPWACRQEAGRQQAVFQSWLWTHTWAHPEPMSLLFTHPEMASHTHTHKHEHTPFPSVVSGHLQESWEPACSHTPSSLLSKVRRPCRPQPERQGRVVGSSLSFRNDNFHDTELVLGLFLSHLENAGNMNDCEDVIKCLSTVLSM